MSEAVQLLVNTRSHAAARSQAAASAAVPSHDSAAEGFSEVFESQMRAEPAPRAEAQPHEQDSGTAASQVRPSVDAAAEAADEDREAERSSRAPAAVAASPVPAQAQAAPSGEAPEAPEGPPAGPASQARPAVAAATAAASRPDEPSPAEAVLSPAPPSQARPAVDTASRAAASAAEPSAVTEPAVPAEAEGDGAGDAAGASVRQDARRAAQALLQSAFAQAEASAGADGEAVSSAALLSGAPAPGGDAALSAPAPLQALLAASSAAPLSGAPAQGGGSAAAVPAGSAASPEVAAGTRGNAPAPRSGQAEMIARLAAAAKLVTGARGGKVLVMRLEPPQLGHVRVQLTVRDGVVTASVQTESEAARQAVLQNVEALRAALAGQGLELGRFDVAAEGPPPRSYAGQGAGRRRREPGEEAAEAHAGVAGAAAVRGEDGDEEPGEVPVSDAMAVDYLA